MKDYKVKYEDEEFELIYADDDRDALQQAFSMEDDHGTVFNVFEIDEDYNEIRTIL